MSIVLNNVNYIYEPGTPQARYALKDINLTIPKGQFIGVIGQTGSGKSTLMQMMNGLIAPTEGVVSFDGQNIHEKGYNKRLLRSKVGMVFQYPEHQLFETTVFRDVCFGPENLNLSPETVQQRAHIALELMNFPKELYENSPFALSGGQKRKAAIAGVLAMEPEYLILDEPTAGLDPRGRDEILELIRTLHRQQGKTILLVSHSMDDVADYVDRIIVLDDGSIKMDDHPKKIFSRYQELEKMGLAAPQVTYIMNALKKKGLPVKTDITTIEEAKEEILRVLQKGRRP